MQNDRSGAVGEITAEAVRRLFGYDPQTGEFVSRVTGKRIGEVDRSGHLRWRVRGITRVWIVRLHRLAWLYVHGEWPAGCIDHINGVKTDNRITNLRDVDVRANNENLSRARPRSKTGLLGVCIHGGGYFGARIAVGGKNVWLGTFPTAEEAHAAYLHHKRSLHPGALAIYGASKAKGQEAA